MYSNKHEHLAAFLIRNEDSWDKELQPLTTCIGKKKCIIFCLQWYSHLIHLDGIWGPIFRTYLENGGSAYSTVPILAMGTVSGEVGANAWLSLFTSKGVLSTAE